jgi:hypothetical protein
VEHEGTSAHWRFRLGVIGVMVALGLMWPGAPSDSTQEASRGLLDLSSDSALVRRVYDERSARLDAALLSGAELDDEARAEARTRWAPLATRRIVRLAPMSGPQVERVVEALVECEREVERRGAASRARLRAGCAAQLSASLPHHSEQALSEALLVLDQQIGW